MLNESTEHKLDYTCGLTMQAHVWVQQKHRAVPIYDAGWVVFNGTSSTDRPWSFQMSFRGREQTAHTTHSLTWSLLRYPPPSVEPF